MNWRLSVVFMYKNTCTNSRTYTLTHARGCARTHSHAHTYKVLCNTPGFTTAPITEPDWSDAGRIRHSGEQNFTGTAEERISSPTKVTLISARVTLIYSLQQIQIAEVHDVQKHITKRAKKTFLGCSLLLVIRGIIYYYLTKWPSGLFGTDFGSGPECFHVCAKRTGATYPSPGVSL